MDSPSTNPTSSKYRSPSPIYLFESPFNSCQTKMMVNIHHHFHMIFDNACSQHKRTQSASFSSFTIILFFSFLFLLRLLRLKIFLEVLFHQFTVQFPKSMFVYIIFILVSQQLNLFLSVFPAEQVQLLQTVGFSQRGCINYLSPVLTRGEETRPDWQHSEWSGVLLIVYVDGIIGSLLGKP